MIILYIAIPQTIMSNTKHCWANSEKGKPILIWLIKKKKMNFLLKYFFFFKSNAIYIIVSKLQETEKHKKQNMK